MRTCAKDVRLKKVLQFIESRLGCSPLPRFALACACMLCTSSMYASTYISRKVARRKMKFTRLPAPSHPSHPNNFREKMSSLSRPLSHTHIHTLMVLASSLRCTRHRRRRSFVSFLFHRAISVLRARRRYSFSFLRFVYAPAAERRRRERSAEN